MPGVTASMTLTERQREALDWAWRTLNMRHAGHQPSATTLNNLAALKLITFTLRKSCRMTIVHDLVITDLGEHVRSEGHST